MFRLCSSGKLHSAAYVKPSALGVRLVLNILSADTSSFMRKSEAVQSPVCPSSSSIASSILVSRGAVVICGK